MKKTTDERIQIAQSFHEQDIYLVIRLLSFLADSFFSESIDGMNEEKRNRLKSYLAFHYETINSILTIAICLLSDMDADLDAASDVKSDAVSIRKKFMCEIYGLTEDADPAGEHSDR